MSTSQVNPMPFDGPKRDSTDQDEVNPNSAEDSPLAETGLPDADEDPNDQLPRD
ncbi:hypothetical protein [Kribbella sp. NPDC006257]|uniref:hypothetical protein n=1 Tax=Kribbella sp. NPDC006257 TaxID=3156738 RepID=UPI0033A86479